MQLQADTLQGLVIAVIGGGIVGRSVAVALQACGASVTLVDPDQPARPLPGGATTGPASFGNAGHLATEQIRPLTHPATLPGLPGRYFPLGGALDADLRSRPVRRWLLRALASVPAGPTGERALAALLADALPAWERMAERVGDPALVRADGHLVLWERGGRAEAASLLRGDTGTATARLLAPAERGGSGARSAASGADEAGADRRRSGGAFDTAAWAFPARPHGAAPARVAFSGTGQVATPARAMASLAAALARSGGRRLAGRAVEVIAAAGRYAVLVEAGIPARGEIVRADAVVVASGLGAAGLLAPLGVALPLIAERGYHVEWSPGRAWTLPPCVFEDRSMILTGFGDRLRACSFVEFAAQADAPPDLRKWTRLERHVRALGLPVASGFDRWVGARPTLPDYLPALGPLEAQDGVFVACGHQHLGLTLAPVTAEIVAASVAARFGRGPGPAIDLAPFRPERFARPARRAGRGSGVARRGLVPKRLRPAW